MSRSFPTFGLTSMNAVLDTREAILQALKQYELIDPPVLTRARSISGSARELLSWLQEQHLLTRFQAETLLRGGAESLVLSHFQLVEEIGTGAMGTVYKARSTKDQAWYALKTVPRKNVINLKTIAEKVEALKQVRHPRVSAMVHVGAQGDRVYMAWPFLEAGVKLDEVVRRQQRLAPKQAAQVALQVASGLQAYHQHHLFHGLLKPNDILIGSDRRVRILDFGVGVLLTCERGKSLLSTMTNGRALARGLDCASPESIVDPLARSIWGDQYSLGCILYYCLTGQFPFPEPNPVKKMLGHQFEQPTPLAQLAPDTPRKLQAIVERLLAKLPEERYETTEELVAELQMAAADSRSTVPAVSRSSGTNRIIAATQEAPAVSQPESGREAPPEEPKEIEKREQRIGTGPWLVLAGAAFGAVAGVLTWLLRG